jgi:hypothetical protein
VSQSDPRYNCDVSRRRRQPDLRFAGSPVSFAALLWSGWSSRRLVVASGVDGEFAEQFAGGGVDDTDLQVLDEQDGGGSGVGDHSGTAGL